MKAMILAAGRGERMMPLTADTPKPMLKLAGKPLLQYHIEKLAQAGITDIVINVAWCGDKIIEYFGNGSQFNVSIEYSVESDGALETAGGIVNALPLLSESTQQNEPFLVVNGDVYCEFDFQNLPSLPATTLGCLFLISNPEHNLAGDFNLSQGKVVNLSEASKSSLTFSGIALYRDTFFKSLNKNTKQALGPLLREAANKEQLMGLKLEGLWTDVGTPQRLDILNLQLHKSKRIKEE